MGELPVQAIRHVVAKQTIGKAVYQLVTNNGYEWNTKRNTSNTKEVLYSSDRDRDRRRLTLERPRKLPKQGKQKNEERASA